MTADRGLLPVDRTTGMPIHQHGHRPGTNDVYFVTNDKTADTAQGSTAKAFAQALRPPF
ncbi:MULTISPECIES: hypothetical protein [unclassified Mycolicibacterium]|uniref:hypothetical protein n=1 Tax=unclassified Mycolicibacterium TaxID=2636767 RepID=UPI0012DEA8ED|nr:MULTISPECIES: hypothetical protein [unclassified Mycolicibacterium]